MGAVVSAVTSVFKAVGNAVGDIVEGVGDIVETVVDDVVKPVVKAVENTVQNALNDPIGTIAKVAVAIVAPELLPAVNMADSLAHGVPLEKALLNTGINMIAGNIGNEIGNVATNTFDLSCAASNVVTAGAKGAVASTIKGQNPLCGAVGSIINNAVNTGANQLYKCITASSRCGESGSSNTGLPVTVKSATDDCAKGCASNAQTGALPTTTNTTQVGQNKDCAVNVTGNRAVCTDVTGGLTRGLAPTGSANNQDAGANTVVGGLDTVNVAGKLEKCTDLVCTNTPTNKTCTSQNQTPTGGLPVTTSLAPVTVTGSKEKCTDLTCAKCTFNPNAPASGTLGTVLVTAKSDQKCKDITCNPTVTVTGKTDTCCKECNSCKTPTTSTTTKTLPVVTVTGKKDTCTDVTCSCECCDCEKTTVKVPKFPKVPKVRTKKPTTQTTQTAGVLGCSAIPWLDTRDSLLRNQIVPVGQKASPTANESKMQDIYASMHPDLAKEMQDRFGGVPQIKLNPFGEAKEGGLIHGFAGGGTSSCVASCSFAYCYNQDSKYMPKFIACGSDMLTNSASSKRQQLTPKQLSQLQQHISTMGNMGGLAAGGLPKKYRDAMPDDHNPEFVTGMTGYYACGGGTGQSDDIPAMLHDGDYVMDADVVAALGDGSSKAGREVLEGFRSQIPHNEKTQGKPVPAKIADGEYVFPAGFVSALGGGDNKAGAKILDGLREKLRAHKRSAPTSKIPPKAKSPLDYIKQAKG